MFATVPTPTNPHSTTDDAAAREVELDQVTQAMSRVIGSATDIMETGLNFNFAVQSYVTSGGGYLNNVWSA